MLEAGRNWQLFGYDTRALGKYWLGAWRSLWWAEESPVRRHFDEVVCLHREDGAALYQAGRECPPAPFVCEAIALPDDLVLARQLRLPLAVEPDLAAVIALEVSANSPFTGGDTSHGWQVLGRGDEQLRVLLVIVSRSAVMTYLGRQYGIHDARAREVWAQVDGASVVLHGFGEERRETLYRRRLRKCGLMLAAAAALLFTVVAVAAGVKRAELLQIEARAASAQREAAGATRLRAALVLANETILATNRVVQLYPNPHVELARLTQLLGDDTHLSRFTVAGREIRLRGRAADAASVMQKLTDQSAYASVTAPSAFVKLGNSGLEQFSLNITLSDHGVGQGPDEEPASESGRASAEAPGGAAGGVSR